MLKKYKDKLYTFLVLKNSAIASEYQSYVTADTERHEKHRLKSWIYLLKLNWKYRVLRGKPAKKPGKQPYVDGPESELSKRPLPIIFAKSLLNYDVVSFDIFDTLLLRPFVSPKDIFFILAEKLMIPDFYNIRINAEQKARKINAEKGMRDISIYDIYEVIKQEIGLDVEYGVNVEFETELEFCIPNPYMKRIYKLLVAQNKRIIAVSDMYLPKQMILKLLHKCGYNSFYEVYVSNEYNMIKADGSLFNFIIKELGNLNFIHIGDNYKSDILGSSIAGWNNWFYKNVNDIGKEYRANGMSPRTYGQYAGCINLHLHNGIKSYNKYYELGFIYGGLYIYGFMNHVHSFAKNNKIDKILFLARDGDIYVKVFNFLYNDINNEYLLWSRFATLKYYTKYNKSVFFKYASQGLNLCSFREIFDTLDINNFQEEFCKYIKDYNFSFDSIMDKINKEIFYDFCHKYWEQIVNLKYKDDESAKTYISKTIANSKNILIVDIGWAGTGPIILKDLIENRWKLKTKVNIMLAASHSYCTQPLRRDTHHYLFSEDLNRLGSHLFHKKNLYSACFEMFNQSTTPSFLNFELDENGKIKYNFTMPDIENFTFTKDIQNGIMDFIHIWHRNFGKYDYLSAVSGHNAYMPFKYLMQYYNAIDFYYHSAVQATSISGREHIFLDTFINILKRNGVI